MIARLADAVGASHPSLWIDGVIGLSRVVDHLWQHLLFEFGQVRADGLVQLRREGLGRSARCRVQRLAAVVGGIARRVDRAGRGLTRESMLGALRRRVIWMRLVVGISGHVRARRVEAGGHAVALACCAFDLRLRLELVGLQLALRMLEVLLLALRAWRDACNSLHLRGVPHILAVPAFAHDTTVGVRVARLLGRGGGWRKLLVMHGMRTILWILRHLLRGETWIHVVPKRVQLARVCGRRIHARRGLQDLIIY